MDIYRVSRKGFKRDEVSLGTKTAVHATVGYVKSCNAVAERYGYKKLSVTIERALIGEFTDVTAEFMEAGTRDSSGDSPDSPAPGEAGLPGGSEIAVSADASADYAGTDWPVIPEGYNCMNFYEVPDGTSLSDFLAEIRGNETPGSAAKNY